MRKGTKNTLLALGLVGIIGATAFIPERIRNPYGRYALIEVDVGNGSEAYEQSTGEKAIESTIHIDIGQSYETPQESPIIQYARQRSEPKDPLAPNGGLRIGLGSNDFLFHPGNNVEKALYKFESEAGQKRVNLKIEYSKGLHEKTLTPTEIEQYESSIARLQGQDTEIDYDVLKDNLYNFLESNAGYEDHEKKQARIFINVKASYGALLGMHEAFIGGDLPVKKEPIGFLYPDENGILRSNSDIGIDEQVVIEEFQEKESKKEKDR